MHPEITAIVALIALTAAVLAALHTRYTSAFLRAGAVSPRTAKSLNELGLRDSPIRRRLTRKAVLVKAAGGFYVDEPTLDRRRSRSRLIGVLVLTAALVTLTVAFLWA